MFILRPWANGATDLTGATLVAESTLPQTLSGLTPGSYEIGRISWNATEMVVTAAGDTTPPTLSGVSLTETDTTATLVWSTNEGNGTAYWLVDGNATRTAAQVIAGGTFAGSRTVTATGAQTAFVATSLTAATAYYFHLVHQDAAGNNSTVSSTSFTTDAAAAATFNTSTSGPRFEADHNVPVGTSAITVSARLRLNMAGWSSAVRHLVHFGSSSFVFSINFDGGVQLAVSDGTGVIVRTLSAVPGVTVPTDGSMFDVIIRPDLVAAVTKITVNGVTTDVSLDAATTPTFQTATNRRATFLSLRTTGANQLAAEIEYIKLWYSGIASGLEPGVAPFWTGAGNAATVNAFTSPFLKQGTDAT